jgi:undecaprenyl diphosphate synthase
LSIRCEEREVTMANQDRRGLHVGIIMDGNGRWAEARGWPRVAGHGEGAKAVRRVIEAAPDLGISTLTLYAFSSDNWRRPAPEVAALMDLFVHHLGSEAAECVEKGVRIGVIGRRDRLSPSVRAAMEQTERLTRDGRRLLVRLAVDYSGRDALLEAARKAALQAAVAAGMGIEEAARPLSREAFSYLLAEAMHADEATDLDLLVRSGGEQRISDFMLWEAAYAEMVFTSRMWPDFDGEDLAMAVAEFWRRERRFGTVAGEPWPLDAGEVPARLAADSQLLNPARR